MACACAVRSRAPFPRYLGSLAPRGQDGLLPSSLVLQISALWPFYLGTRMRTNSAGKTGTDGFPGLQEMKFYKQMFYVI